ncbi:rRNA maturation RNase YbeY [Holzapfeliella floricola]|uniref:Endoribonuclease YbeY n=1 Tax=Holzapfeliella floricola DSM 23037 = JCM 16512 TaxID=1423744 RepID=A0A0R2DS97_9LACO|nr:rRNA maturation RNase YbeY [Holzapfeliella floricola]KRN03767.1 hypothetical protein FC86_GL000879 [Holzapfeliella floricola DSM 23037 = JCM 16512]
MSQLDITIINEENLLSSKQVDWAQRLLDYTKDKIAPEQSIEMSVSFVSEDEIKKINQTYRGKDNSTDVISFAIEDGEDQDEIEMLQQTFGIARNIGDLIICPAIVAEHGEEYGHGFDREFGYTLVHGFLHLSGYDHIDPEEEKEMIGLQNQILDDYGLKR